MAASDSLSAASACSAESWRAALLALRAGQRRARAGGAAPPRRPSSARALAISEVSSSVDGLRSEPPLTQPAPTRSPSRVTARNCGRSATRLIASPRLPTTATPDSMATIAPRNRPGTSTRSRAHRRRLAARPSAPTRARASRSTRAPRGPRRPASSAATASRAAPKLSAASASAAEPRTAASAAS